MHIPLSTYRLQLSEKFTFADAESILPYLQSLGISDIYISPILQAQAHSTHGYDVIDHGVINPELGGELGFKQFAKKLNELNLNLLVDIVPNHMAATTENKYWIDVVKQRQQSPYANRFDIDWIESTPEKLSYRRFFDVNELVCLRCEDAQIFTESHALILHLVQKGYIQGLRIDHPDGLRNPTEYLITLRKKAPRCYIVLEKVLAPHESLPKLWPVEGVTGYDFLSQMNQMFVSKVGLDQIIAHYNMLTDNTCTIDDIVAKCVKIMIKTSFHHEFNVLAKNLHALIGGCINDLKEILEQLSTKMNQYRFYSPQQVKEKASTKILQTICQTINTTNVSQARQLKELMAILLLQNSRTLSSEEQEERTQWRNNWEVFNVPVIAKSFEDTACYTYNPFISFNEVGMGPTSYEHAGDLNVFHNYNVLKHHTYPHGMNASSTHDTKRSEDVRARLNVLSEMADEWNEILNHWLHHNQTHKSLVNGLLSPDITDEILIYQTLLGTWPLQPSTIILEQFKARLEVFIKKAMRERKIHSTWANPNLPYEDATLQFLHRLFEDSVFQRDFLPWQHKIAFYGMYHSLMQLILKITCPGVPDFYQGQETWRFDLVDPDNRQSIDFAPFSLLSSERSFADLLSNWENGQIKFNLTKHLLHVRHDYKLIFQQGNYIPLVVVGPHAEHICAFARCYHEQWIIVVVVRWMSKLLQLDKSWSSRCLRVNDGLILPHMFKHYQSLLTSTSFTSENHSLSLNRVLAETPFQLLFAQK